MVGKNDHRRLNDMVPVTNKDWYEKKLSRPPPPFGIIAEDSQRSCNDTLEQPVLKYIYFILFLWILRM